MAISRSKKEEILNSLTDSFKSAKSIVFAKNKGLTVADSKNLRTVLRENDVNFVVAKKTLFKKAAENTGIAGFDISILDGAVGAAISNKDEVIGAKTIATFNKKNPNIELVAGIIEGEFLGKKEIVNISKLPSKEELYAKMLGSMQAPLSNFVGIGNNLISGFVRCLNQISEKK